MATHIDVPKGSRRAKRSSVPIESCEGLLDVPSVELERVSEWCKRMCVESEQHKSYVKYLEGQIETMRGELDKQNRLHLDQIRAIAVDRDRSHDHIQTVLAFFGRGVRCLYDGLSDGLDDARWLMEYAQEANPSVFGIGNRPGIGNRFARTLDNPVKESASLQNSRNASVEVDPSEVDVLQEISARRSEGEVAKSDSSNIVIVLVKRPAPAVGDLDTDEEAT